MSVEEVTEVCRLCLKNETLVWIFNTQSEIPENMKDVIFITTGVKVSELILIGDFLVIMFRMINIRCLFLMQSVNVHLGFDIGIS